MKKYFVFVLCLVSASCSSTPPQSVMSGGQKDELRTALYKGNYDEFKKLISDYPTLSNYDRFDFLKASLANGCNPDEVKLIMDKNSSLFEETLKGTYGKKNFAERFQALSQSPDKGYEQRPDVDAPGMIITSLAGKKFCHEALTMLKDKVSSPDWAKALYTPIEDFSSQWAKKEKLEDIAVKAIKGTQDDDEEGGTRIFTTLKILGDRIQQDCEKSIPESCEAQKSMESIKGKLKQEIADREYWNGPEGTFSQACDVYRQLQNQQGYIDHQKEVSRTSGVVNKKVLYDAGSMVVHFKNQLEPLKAKYKKQTGKSFNPKDCE